MTLQYTNPNDWGKSPLDDNALRIEQIKAENKAALKTPAIIEITSENNPDIWELLQPPSEQVSFLREASPIRE
ncbi:hypothetical protein LC653_42550 [Nostoc sp. CHAB 5784]|uniref:hypothetical protein n=1 Tax=Nostoc mirabile TaxID=2907820 RepID=UPI001E2DE6FD|nr:hypothetical protein [Nostoc mirabile]MCC5670297.1 hypothetical protein [Nostoc mirabile CHAB5784]